MGIKFGINEVDVPQFQAEQPSSLTRTGVTPKLRMKPSPNFLYMHHPQRWQYKNGKILPLLAKLNQTPGLMNVSHKGGDMTKAIAGQIQNGWQILPHDIIEGGYVRVYDGFQGKVHLSKWETPRQHGNNSIKPATDAEGYDAFLEGLLNEGIIKPPADWVLESMVSKARDRVQRLAPYTTTEAGKNEHANALKDLEALEIACGFKKKPTPKKRPRKKPVKAAPKTEAVDG